MALNRPFSSLLAVALLCAPAPLLAQTASNSPPHVPLQKTIGAVKQAPVPSLIVMNAA